MEAAQRKLEANSKEKENLAARLEADAEKENKGREEMRNMTRNLDEAKAKVCLSFAFLSAFETSR